MAITDTNLGLLGATTASGATAPYDYLSNDTYAQSVLDRLTRQQGLQTEQTTEDLFRLGLTGSGLVSPIMAQQTEAQGYAYGDLAAQLTERARTAALNQFNALLPLVQGGYISGAEVANRVGEYGGLLSSIRTTASIQDELEDKQYAENLMRQAMEAGYLNPEAYSMAMRARSEISDLAAVLPYLKEAGMDTSAVQAKINQLLAQIGITGGTGSIPGTIPGVSPTGPNTTGGTDIFPLGPGVPPITYPVAPYTPTGVAPADIPGTPGIGIYVPNTGTTGIGTTVPTGTNWFNPNLPNYQPLPNSPTQTVRAY